MESTTVEVVLDKQDHEEARVPVAEQAQEVLEEGQQVVATDEGQEDDQHKHDACPDETGHDAQGSGELLHGEAGRVQGDGVHGDAGKGEDHEEELGEADRVDHFLDEPADAHIPGIEPVTLVVEGGTAEGAQDETETGRDGFLMNAG